MPLFSDKIKAQRLENGWSQEELARRSGVSQQTISAWESGRSNNPSTTELLRVAKALGQSPEFFLYSDDWWSAIDNAGDLYTSATDIGDWSRSAQDDIIRMKTQLRFSRGIETSFRFRRIEPILDSLLAVLKLLSQEIPPKAKPDPNNDNHGRRLTPDGKLIPSSLPVGQAASQDAPEKTEAERKTAQRRAAREKKRDAEAVEKNPDPFKGL